MNFHNTKIEGAKIIELEKNVDDRGFFARSFCEREFREHGIRFRVAQANISWNKEKHTLRGMHYQKAPDEEAKIVSCTRGRIYDVLIDLRPDSPTFKTWIAAELTADNRKMLYVPEGVAHGFLTLEPETEVHYFMSAFYKPDAGKGIRWDDPAFNIKWPDEPSVISKKDKEWAWFGDG